MEYFLGIDIGTTSVKAIAFSAEGKTLAAFSMSYPIRHPHPDWSEQDPDEIAAAVFKSLGNILHELEPDTPRLCSFSSAMHSLIAVDQEGNAISPSIIWADGRASDIAADIHKENKANYFYERTGLPVHAMSPFCKLQWIREKDPHLFERTARFIGIKEYIFHQLFKVYVIDASMAASTGLMNATTREWDPEILEVVGLTEDKLSEIVETSQTFNSPLIFPMLKNTIFVIGGSDGAMANLGTTEESGSLVVTVGTSSAARIIVSDKLMDEAMRTFCYYLTPDKWLVGGASNNGGIVLQWLQEDFFHSRETVGNFLDQASVIAPGSDGLIFLPYLLGERAPIWNSEAKGILFGLQIGHQQSHMVRASMEGIVYCIYAISQPLMEKVEIKKIYATGGFARNDLGLQIMADVFNLPVVVCETVENSAWGAVKCGMQALGIFSPETSATDKTFIPNPAIHLQYQKGFLKFQRLYQLLVPEFS